MPEAAKSRPVVVYADVEQGWAEPPKGKVTPSKESPIKERRRYLRSLAWLRPLLLVAVLFVTALLLLLCLVRQLPKPEALARQLQQPASATPLLLKLPHNLQEIRDVKHTLELYREHYYGRVAVLLMAVYLFLQTFSIPGSLCINLLVGSMYRQATAITAIAIISTVGACCNYWLSNRVARGIVVGLFPHRVQAFQQSIMQHKSHLVNYLIFIRITPFLPSWFINLAAPIVGIEFRDFAISTLIGLQPMNICAIEAGQTLSSLKSMRDLWSKRTILTLLICATLAILPICLQRFTRGRKKPVSVLRVDV